MKHLAIVFFFILTAFVGHAQVSIFELWFVADGTQHHGLLLANNTQTWKMRVKFYDRTCSCTRLVEQKIQIEYDDQVGSWLNGSNVKNVYTGQRADFYVADNFFMLTDVYGNTTMYNVDDQGIKTKVTGQNVAAAQKFQKYAEFGW